MFKGICYIELNKYMSS